MGGVVWGKVILVVLACMVSYCHATLPTYQLYVQSESYGRPVTWERATILCAGPTPGTRWLAMPGTSDQASAIKKLLTQQKVHILSGSVWIGLYRKVDGGPFYWANNDPESLGRNPTLGIAWYPGQPDNSGGKENCTVARPSGNDDWGLDDRNCSLDFRSFACEYPDDSPPSMSVTADVVDDGGQVDLTCTWNGKIDTQVKIYTYRKEGSAADILEKDSNLTSDTHTLTPVSVSDTGRYWCTVGKTLWAFPTQTSAFTLSTSNNSVTLRVIPKTPTFSLDPPVPVTGVYDGAQVTFQCASDSATGVSIVSTYHFLQDGIIIKSTDLTYTKKMTTSDIGNYSCKVTMNGVDSAVSNVIALEVSAFPTTGEQPAQDDTTPGEKEKNWTWLIALVCGLGLLMAACGAVAYVVMGRKKQKRDAEGGAAEEGRLADNVPEEAEELSAPESTEPAQEQSVGGSGGSWSRKKSSVAGGPPGYNGYRQSEQPSGSRTVSQASDAPAPPTVEGDRKLSSSIASQESGAAARRARSGSQIQ